MAHNFRFLTNEVFILNEYSIPNDFYRSHPKDISIRYLDFKVLSHWIQEVYVAVELSRSQRTDIRHERCT